MTTPEMLKNLIKSLDDVSSTLTQFLESWKEKDYQRTLDLAERGRSEVAELAKNRECLDDLNYRRHCARFIMLCLRAFGDFETLHSVKCAYYDYQIPNVLETYLAEARKDHSADYRCCLELQHNRMVADLRKKRERIMELDKQLEEKNEG